MGWERKRKREEKEALSIPLVLLKRFDPNPLRNTTCQLQNSKESFSPTLNNTLPASYHQTTLPLIPWTNTLCDPPSHRPRLCILALPKPCRHHPIGDCFGPENKAQRAGGKKSPFSSWNVNNHTNLLLFYYTGPFHPILLAI